MRNPHIRLIAPGDLKPYLQRPMPVEGNLVKWAWFRFYACPPAKEADGRIVQSWDTASKAGELNDYSVCTTWLMKGDDYYLLDVQRERLEYPQLKKRVIEMKRRKSADSVLIEDKGSGTQLIQDLRHEKTGVRPIPIKPEGDKITRMSNQSAKIEAGQVFLPKDAPWLDEFKVEILAFPNSKFADQVDSLSQFLTWAEQKKRRKATVKVLKGGWFSHRVRIKTRLKRCGGEIRLVLLGDNLEERLPKPDPNLIRAIAKAQVWARQLVSGEAPSITEIAKRNGTSRSRAGAILTLAFLAPDVVEAILEGRQPPEVNLERLTSTGGIPNSWEEQRRLYGFS